MATNTSIPKPPLSAFHEILFEELVFHGKKDLRYSAMGKFIQNRRTRRGMSRDHFAKQLGVKKKHILFLENGFIAPDNIADEMIEKIADILGCQPYTLKLLSNIDDNEAYQSEER